MPRKAREIERFLTGKLGFVQADAHSDDHRWYRRTVGGHTIFTKLSHGTKEVGKKIEGKIAKQLRIRGSFFKQAIRCKKSKEDYERQVLTDAFPPFDIA